MKCQRCGQEITADGIYTYREQTLCEECYIKAISPEKECDPWASYLSSRERRVSERRGEDSLTETEKAIYEFIKRNSKVTREEIQDKFHLAAGDLDPQLNVLMHAELIKEHGEGDTMYLIPIPVARG